MSTDLPEDLRTDFARLENQALISLRSGKYELAERLHRMMLDIVLSRQNQEGRRIHKGTYYHMIGFSLVLQKKLQEGLLSFLLAYIEDALNVPIEKESAADSAPAAGVLTKGFNIAEGSLSEIKELVKQSKISKHGVLDPETILADLETPDLFSLCDPKPEIKDVLSILVTTLTPSAQKVLQENVSQRGARILEIARILARKREHSEITEDDIRDAIKQMEGKPQ